MLRNILFRFINAVPFFLLQSKGAWCSICKQMINCLTNLQISPLNLILYQFKIKLR